MIQDRGKLPFNGIIGGLGRMVHLLSFPWIVKIAQEVSGKGIVDPWALPVTLLLLLLQLCSAVY